jgi:hypothetical protein
MTAWYLLAIPLGGFGAVARVFTTRLGERHVPGGAITMTALINIVGAGLIGVVAAIGNDVALLVLGGGLLGGLTTVDGRGRHAPSPGPRRLGWCGAGVAGCVGRGSLRADPQRVLSRRLIPGARDALEAPLEMQRGGDDALRLADASQQPR